MTKRRRRKHIKKGETVSVNDCAEFAVRQFHEFFDSASMLNQLMQTIISNADELGAEKYIRLQTVMSKTIARIGAASAELKQEREGQLPAN
jgi:hypothetical protein